MSQPAIDFIVQDKNDNNDNVNIYKDSYEQLSDLYDNGFIDDVNNIVDLLDRKPLINSKKSNLLDDVFIEQSVISQNENNSSLDNKPSLKNKLMDNVNLTLNSTYFN